MIQRADLASLLSRGAAFLRWWRRELLGMLPASLRAAGPRTILDLRGGSPILARAKRGAWHPLAPAEGVVPKGPIARAMCAEDPLVVAIPPAWIMTRVLRLPAVAEPRLDAVLGFELEQHVPFAAEEVVWSHRVLRRLPDSQGIEVEAAILPRAMVAAAAGALRALGARAPIQARPDPAAEWPAIPLDALSPPRRGWRGRVEAALALAAALLLLQLGHDELSRQQAVLDAVQARAVAARTAAERVLTLQAGVDEARGRLSAAMALRSGRPAAVAVLEDLTQRLPDDAWLTELRLTGSQLSVSGFAARPDALLEVLDASPILREVRFAAPLTRGPRDTADRFQLAMRVVPDAALPVAPVQVVAR